MPRVKVQRQELLWVTVGFTGSAVRGCDEDNVCGRELRGEAAHLVVDR